MTTDSALSTTPPGEKLTVKISSIVEHVITVDPNHPDWGWLLAYPRSRWQHQLEESANTTGGEVEQAIEDEPADAAYRDVTIIGPHSFLPPKSDQPDPWGLS